MATTPSTPSSPRAVPESVPTDPGLPDVALLTQYANALFRSLPGDGVDPLAFNVEPPTDLSPPGAGGSYGSTPTPATIPTTADLPSSLNDRPGGPAAVPPGRLETAIEPGSIRPTSSPAYYFLSDASIPSYGASGEADLLAFLPTLGLPDAPSAPGTGMVTAEPPTTAPPSPALTYSPFLSDRDGLPQSFGADPRPSYDLFAVRRDFPILSERVDGKRLIWFDNAATTQKPRSVIERLVYFYEHENSNIHRAAHALAARSTDAYENARSTVARFINASTPEEIVFARGTTEGINLIASTWGANNLREGDEVLLSHLEHHANIVPWQLLQKTLGFTIKVIPVDEDGQILLDEYTNLVTDRTKLIEFNRSMQHQPVGARVGAR